MRDGTQKGQTTQEEMAALYTKHYQMVLQKAFRIIGSEEDAEDILQDIYVKLVENPELHAGFRKNPAGYLYCAAINAALDMKKAPKFKNRSDEDLDSLTIEAPAFFDPAREDDVRRVRAAIAKMKPDSVEILILHYIEGYTCSEIAKIHSKGLPAVYKELARARSEFKRIIRIQEKQNETQKEKHPGNAGRRNTENSAAQSGGDREPGLAADRGQDGRTQGRTGRPLSLWRWLERTRA